ncbi:MAG: Rieske 2Fe-2S domain-containing protein [Bryobacteraceae bacterium]
MPLVKVKALSELPPGAVAEVDVGGATYAICNVDGDVHCVEGTCPHAGGPLGEGNLDGNYLVCPWHGWEYDCRTGLNNFDEDVRIQTYPTVVQDGNILIDVP